MAVRGRGGGSVFQALQGLAGFSLLSDRDAKVVAVRVAGEQCGDLVIKGVRPVEQHSTGFSDFAGRHLIPSGSRLVSSSPHLEYMLRVVTRQVVTEDFFR